MITESFDTEKPELIQSLNHNKLLNNILLFQLITIALYYYGPIQYVSPSITYGVLFLCLYYLAMLKLGSFFGKKCYFSGGSGPKNAFKFIKYSVVITLIFLPATILSRGGDLASFSQLGEAYSSSAARREENGSAFEYIRMIFGYVLFGFFPLAIVYWRILSRQIKIMAIVGIFLNIFLAFSTGVNKYIFDYVIVFMVWKYLQSDGIKLRSRRFWRTLVIGVVAILSVGYFFTQSQLTRDGSSAISGFNPSINAYSEFNADDGELLVFYSALSSYLTQGYRAIDLSLNEPAVFTWGVGNSSFFSRQFDRIFGTQVLDQSYPARIEKYGWDRYNQWSSFYLWWASDLSHIGVGLLMVVFGFLYSSIANTAAKTKDCASIIILTYLIIGLFYLSANNQLMQSGETAIGFLSILLPYLIKRKLRRMI